MISTSLSMVVRLDAQLMDDCEIDVVLAGDAWTMLYVDVEPFGVAFGPSSDCAQSSITVTGSEGTERVAFGPSGLDHGECVARVDHRSRADGVWNQTVFISAQTEDVVARRLPPDSCVSQNGSVITALRDCCRMPDFLRTDEGIARPVAEVVVCGKTVERSYAASVFVPLTTPTSGDGTPLVAGMIAFGFGVATTLALAVYLVASRRRVVGSRKSV